jgi:hypothetical protein
VYFPKRKEFINPQLQALKKKEKNHQNYHFCACAQNQSRNQLWGALRSINLGLLRVCPKPIEKSTLGRAPFNQSGSFVRTPKTNQVINLKCIKKFSVFQ